MDNDITIHGYPEPTGEAALAPVMGSTAEYLAMKSLLRLWLDYGIKNIAMPGAWEYDKEAAEMVEDTARLLGIERPWSRR